MALDNALITQQRLMAAKLETTTGTAIDFEATDAAFNVFEPELNYNFNYIQRAGQSSASPLTGTSGLKTGTFTFQSELQGDGVSGSNTWGDVLLAGCGFAATGTTFTTGKALQETLTMGLYEDGRVRRIAGAVGKVTFNFITGQPVKASWEFTGKYELPATAAILAPTYPTTIPPRFSNATVTVGAVAQKISEMEIVVENEIAERHNPADNDTGIYAYTITNRKVTVTMDSEAALAKNWYTSMDANTEVALEVILGSNSGNVVTIGAPAMQLTELNSGDRNGILTDALTFQCNRSAAAGDDELSITFG